MIMAAFFVVGHTPSALAQSGGSTRTHSGTRKASGGRPTPSAHRPSPEVIWPVPNVPTPLPGSILPAKRIVAFYGNPLSKRMGILGEVDSATMLARLDREVAAWNKADPEHPVLPALHLIAVVASG